MIVCCKHAYLKYINDNYSIDESRFKRIESGNYSILSVPIVFDKPKKVSIFNLFMKKPSFDVNPVFRYSYKKIENGKTIDICNCDCHKDGEVVLH